MHNLRCFRRLNLGLSCVVTLLFSGLLLVTSVPVTAQTPVLLMQPPRPQYFDTSGLPLAFGCVFTYQVGTTTPLATYTDRTGSVQNTNPVILDASGGLASSIWIQAGQAYTIKVMSTGGTNCASGSTIYSVDGVGGGVSQLTTNVAYSATPTFADASQNQLFTITLTGSATSQPLTAVGVVPPGLVTWQITQDTFGGHTFSWPANTVGGATICPSANCVTQQTFLWNGTNAQAVGPANYSTPAMAVPNFFDYGLTANSAVCVSAAFELITGAGCNSALGVTFNGQTVQPGGAGNVNSGAAAHSVAINEGNGSAIAGVTLANDQANIGRTGADPVASTVPDCQGTNGADLTYNQSTHAFGCATTGSVGAPQRVALGSPVSVSATTQTTVLTESVTMPATTGTYRLLVSYVVWMTIGANLCSAEVIDTTNSLPFAASGQNANGTGYIGLAGSEITSHTYAQSSTITVHLDVMCNNAAGGLVGATVNMNGNAIYTMSPQEPTYLSVVPVLAN